MRSAQTRFVDFDNDLAGKLLLQERDDTAIGVFPVAALMMSQIGHLPRVADLLISTES